MKARFRSQPRYVQFRFVGQYDRRLVDGYRDPVTGDRIVLYFGYGASLEQD